MEDTLTLNKKKIDVKYNILAMLSFVVFAFVLLLPFFTSSVHSGHDIEYHFSMIRSLCNSWDSGKFFSKIDNLTCQDYGYGNGIFYSVVPAGLATIFIKVFHLNLTGAVGLEIALLFAANGIVFYWFLKRMFNKQNLAWVCALLYMCAPYVLNQLYVRFSFSEIFLSLAIPLIFWGLFELLVKNNKGLFMLLFTSGYCLSILCHLTMTIYLTIFVVVALCFFFKQIFKQGKVVPLAVSTIIVLLVCAFYYIPMLANFGLSNTTSNLSYTSAFLWFNGTWAFALPYLLVSTIISLIVIVKFAKYLKQNKGQNNKYEVCLFVLLNSSFIASTCIFPWFLLPNFVGMIQYVWRLYVLNATFVYVAFAFLIFKQGRIKNLFKTLIVILTISLCSFGLNAVSSHSKNGFWFASTSVDVKRFENEISNQSDNCGIGSHKKLNYTPSVANANYIFTRANDALVLDTNLKVKELANYFSLEQISFVVTSSNSGFVVLKIPFEECKNLKVYQFSTDVECKVLNPTISSKNIDDKQWLKLDLENFKGESKVTISYKNDLEFKNYLVKNPFEFICTSGEMSATNFVKSSASEYVVEFATSGATVELPTIYYKGYKLTYKNAQGEIYNITPKMSDNGFIEIELKESGVLQVEYAPNFENLANKISLVGLGAFALSVPACVVVDAVEKRKVKRNSK